MKSLLSEENGISVIVPSFQSNLEQLCRCLKSISNQIADNLNIECYVIFDGEPFKNIQHILDIYPNFHFITIKHGGVSIARNEGIQHSHCRYLTFVDVDDELPDHALKKCMIMLNKILVTLFKGHMKQFFPLAKSCILIKSKDSFMYVMMS